MISDGKSIVKHLLEDEELDWTEDSADPDAQTIAHYANWERDLLALGFKREQDTAYTCYGIDRGRYALRVRPFTDGRIEASDWFYEFSKDGKGYWKPHDIKKIGALHIIPYAKQWLNRHDRIDTR
jgi:hypothetical protein